MEAPDNVIPIPTQLMLDVEQFREGFTRQMELMFLESFHQQKLTTADLRKAITSAMEDLFGPNCVDWGSDGLSYSVRTTAAPMDRKSRMAPIIDIEIKR